MNEEHQRTKNRNEHEGRRTYLESSAPRFIITNIGYIYILLPSSFLPGVVGAALLAELNGGVVAAYEPEVETEERCVADGAVCAWCGGVGV